MKRIEALADAISAYNGYSDPTSLFYKLRNPGALKAFLDRHDRHESGYRFFDSHLDGYRALLHDLGVKIDGKSSFGIGPKSPLILVLPAFNVPILDSKPVFEYINQSLNLDGINENTTLGFFRE